MHEQLLNLIDGDGKLVDANGGAVTWEELARRAAHTVGVSTANLRAVPVEELGLAAPRPRYTALESVRGTLLSPLDDALQRYARARAWEQSYGGATSAGTHGPVNQPKRSFRNSTSTPSTHDSSRAALLARAQDQV